MVTKCQRTAFYSDIFPLFQLPFYFICWHHIILQGLFQPFLLLVEWNIFQKTDFVKCAGIMIVRECQTPNIIDSCLPSKIKFLQDYWLAHSEKDRNRIVGNFLVWHLVDKLSILFFHWNPDGIEVPELFVIWDQFDFGTCVSPNQLAWFLPSRSQSKAFNSCWIIALELVDFFVQWNADGPDLPENAFSLDMKVIKLLFLQLYLLRFLFFRQGVNRYFFTWGQLLVCKYHEDFSLCRNWSSDWPRKAKVLFVLG